MSEFWVYSPINGWSAVNPVMYAFIKGCMEMLPEQYEGWKVAMVVPNPNFVILHL